MAHIHEEIDFVVTVLIVYNNKVLLVFHKKQQMWLPVGGHIELNEHPDEALMREIQEECGLEVEILSDRPVFQDKGRHGLYTPNYLDIHNITDTHKHIGLTYFAKAKSGEVKLAEQEHEDIRWFSQEELDNPEYSILEDVKFYVKEAIKTAVEK